MTTATVPTIRYDIFIAGDLAQAKQVCREHCFEVGLCVTVEPVKEIGEPPQPVTDVWECANQLAGYVGPDTEDRLAEFLLRESRTAEELAKEIVRQSEQIASLTKERDEALAEVERMTPNFVAYDYLESPVRADVAEAEVAALKSRLAQLEQEAVKVVEPFEEVASEGNEDQPDDTLCTIQAGRSTCYGFTLSHFRAARAFLDKLRRPS